MDRQVKSLKILYVEDDKTIIQFIKIVFKNNNLNDITYAYNGREALEFCQTNIYDIILTDVMMPIMNGFELIEKVRKINDKQIFIMVTGLNDKEDLIKAISLRVNHFIQKPIRPINFIQTLNESIELVNQRKSLNFTNLLLKQYQQTMDKSTILSKTDPQGIITYVNDSFCNISQYSQDELIGKNHNIIRHQDMPPLIFTEMWHTIKTLKQSWSGIIINKKKDGSSFWTKSIINPVLDEENNIIEYISVRTDITAQERAKKEIEEIHQNIKSSIKYASLIQGALIPEDKVFKNYFKDYFVLWEPKDTVGGDIYLFNELRHSDECLLMFIDCTGHGVPGAFVTMLVKAIERQIIAKIEYDRYNDIDVSPAWIMQYFNKSLKKLLKQETKNSISNAGFDGGIIYYNKKTQILKYAGAYTPLFYIDENKEFQTIKGDKYSVGYKKCDSNYKYKETILKVEKSMKFYCTTDGYLDQNGGKKDFPFGKKRFENIIKNNFNKSMSIQKDIFIDEMMQYEKIIKNNDRNDDMTVIAFEI